MYVVLTSYKYLDCLLLNLFNQNSQQIKMIKTRLKNKNYFSSCYTIGMNGIKKYEITKTLTIKLTGIINK